jgi:hypothetical protein
MIVNFKVIFFDKFKPPTLPHVEIGLSENIFEDLMIDIDVAMILSYLVFKTKPNA